MRLNVLVLLVSLGFNVPAFADEASDYEKLSQIPGKYEVFGTICEYLTKIRLEDQYSPTKYDIEVGIEYRQGGRVVGEIDVVVFRKADKEAVLVGQVKCRQHMARAHGHAHEQNQRFLTAMNRRNSRQGKITFRSTSNPDLVVTESMMDEVESYITASQDGGLLHGFTMTVGHDLDTVSAMRDRLLKCQEDSFCPKPR